MIAGSESISHSVTSITFQIKSKISIFSISYINCLESQAYGNPEIFKKLQKEMTNYGFFSNKNKNELFTKGILQSFDYLNYIIKEGLRLDNPSFDTFGYKTYDDVEICGVPIPKNTGIFLNTQIWTSSIIKKFPYHISNLSRFILKVQDFMLWY